MNDQDQNRLFAYYANGQDARWQRVEVQLAPAVHPDRLRLTLPDGAVEEWPLYVLRRLPDQAGRASILLSRSDDPLSRLSIRGKGPVDHIKKLAPDLLKRPPVENVGRMVKWGLGAIASVALIIFVLVPVMADQLAEFLPPEGEKALGDKTFEQIRVALNQAGAAPLPLCTAPAGTAALEKMRVRLNAEGDLPYPLQVHVLDHDLVNAFALPGGHVALFRGLIEAAETPEEVAAVLAHEVGHVAHRDPTRDALRSAGSIGVLGLLFGDFAGGTAVLFMANQLINASYSQAAEAGADEFAHEVLTDAEVSPGALGTMFARLRDKHGDAEGIIAHLASHPTMADRIEAARVAAEASGVETRPILSEAEWQDMRAICGERSYEALPEEAPETMADAQPEPVPDTPPHEVPEDVPSTPPVVGVDGREDANTRP